jgi:hypothetical protein
VFADVFVGGVLSTVSALVILKPFCPFTPTGFLWVVCEVLRRGDFVGPAGSSGKAFFSSPVEELSKPVTEVGRTPQVSRFQDVR